MRHYNGGYASRIRPNAQPARREMGCWRHHGPCGSVGSHTRARRRGCCRREEVRAEGDVELSVLPAQLWSEPTAPPPKERIIERKERRSQKPICQTVLSGGCTAVSSALGSVTFSSWCSYPCHPCVLTCISLMNNGAGSLLLCHLVAVPLFGDVSGHVFCPLSSCAHAPRALPTNSAGAVVLLAPLPCPPLHLQPGVGAPRGLGCTSPQSTCGHSPFWAFVMESASDAPPPPRAQGEVIG